MVVIMVSKQRIVLLRQCQVIVAFLCLPASVPDGIIGTGFALSSEYCSAFTTHLAVYIIFL